MRDGQELIDVVNRTKGQGVLNLLALDDVRSQVDDAIRDPTRRRHRRRRAPASAGGGRAVSGS